jgi:hypothetical protein
MLRPMRSERGEQYTSGCGQFMAGLDLLGTRNNRKHREMEVRAS